MIAHSAGPRSLRVGEAVNRDRHFIADTGSVDKLKDPLMNGRYMFYIDRRQGGKSTTAKAVVEDMNAQYIFFRHLNVSFFLLLQQDVIVAMVHIGIESIPRGRMSIY